MNRRLLLLLVSVAVAVHCASALQVLSSFENVQQYQDTVTGSITYTVNQTAQVSLTSDDSSGTLDVGGSKVKIVANAPSVSYKAVEVARIPKVVRMYTQQVCITGDKGRAQAVPIQVNYTESNSTLSVGARRRLLDYYSGPQNRGYGNTFTAESQQSDQGNGQTVFSSDAADGVSWESLRIMCKDKTLTDWDTELNGMFNSGDNPYSTAVYSAAVQMSRFDGNPSIYRGFGFETNGKTDCVQHLYETQNKPNAKACILTSTIIIERIMVHNSQEHKDTEHKEEGSEQTYCAHGRFFSVVAHLESASPRTGLIIPSLL
jgi:hypothetical protein